jgi:hypothetical protein
MIMQPCVMRKQELLQGNVDRQLGYRKSLVWFASQICLNPVDYTGVMAATCSNVQRIWITV